MKKEILPDLDVIFNYAYTDAKISKDNKPTKIEAYLPGKFRHITNDWAMNEKLIVPNGLILVRNVC